MSVTIPGRSGSMIPVRVEAWTMGAGMLARWRQEIQPRQSPWIVDPAGSREPANRRPARLVALGGHPGFADLRGRAARGQPAASADPNDLSLIVVFLCFATVGAVLASRRAHNAVGWICSAIGFTAIFGGFSESYGAYAVEHPGSLPAAGLVAWPGATWLWLATVGLMVLFLPAVPDRPPALAALAAGRLGSRPGDGRGLPSCGNRPWAAREGPACQPLPAPSALGAGAD